MLTDTANSDQAPRENPLSVEDLPPLRTAMSSRHGAASGLSAPARWVLSASAAGAGVIHLAMVPSHASESAVDGVGFAVVGWAQIVLAAAVLLRPSRMVMRSGAILNLAVIGLWGWSRTAGLPFGGHPDHAADITVVDGVATALAGVAVLLCVAGLLSRRSADDRSVSGAGFGLGGALAAGALVATSLALASPAASDHASASHGAHSSVAGDGSATVVPAAQGGTSPQIGDGHAHSTDGAVDGQAAVSAGAVPAAANTLSSGEGGAAVATPAPVPAAGHGHSPAAQAPAGVDLSTRCDLGFNPVSYWDETRLAAVDTAGGGAYAVAAQPSAEAGSPALDSLIALTAKPGGAEAKDAAVVTALGNVDAATYRAWLRWLPTYSASTHSSSGSGDDNGGHGGHLGPQAWIAMTDQAECDQLAKELAQAKQVGMQYQTAADATAGGWSKVTGFVPGIAAHYMKFASVDGQFNIDEPEMLLYDGDGPDAQLVGLSYYLLHDSDFEPSQGFTGPNDHFHRHVGLCVGNGGVIGDSSTTVEECAARGGTKTAGFGGWMNHVWVVPGCESPWGLFSGASPTLDGAMRKNSGPTTVGCSGSGVLDRFDLAPGTPDNVPPEVVGLPAK